MLRFFLAILVVLAWLAGPSLAQQISSIAPERGTPGTLVVIGGGPFSDQARPQLGEIPVRPLHGGENFLEFAVPELPPGNYQLTVRQGERTTSGAFRFEVMAPTPEITEITPRNLDVCRQQADDLVAVNGRNFQNGAVVQVNDLVVPSTLVNANLIEARLDAFQDPGVLGVQVRNPDGAVSLPFSIWIDGIPEITSVQRGADFVNYYEVIISGKNFLPNSTLVVEEPEATATGSAFRQFSFGSRPNAGSGNSLPPQHNRLIYQDCHTLVYHRYPSNFQDKDLSLQVLNPNGQRTDPYQITLP